ncbi:DUF192 domain-containing protein [Pontimicrobium aquaticum]|uniref:DUF192 domain-containing protein n=1 Tax=Pontimicrobium aquaticum TaxID=2565367 RepID=A0A4U0EYT2_9FLAO|nr:DUF192 domain-containing protein [Pontimicrobium aquaticum]TJY37251.1 DUF192 domain-containing protein [Pontimicrobium aquaticum]
MKLNKLTKSLIVLALSSLLLLIVSCKEDKKIITPTKVTFKKEGELSLIKAENDSVIAMFDIEIADNEYETQTGLMNRKSMKDSNAMLFIFPDMQMRAFYMKNTLIPLDIIYLDNNKTIVSIQENAKPLDESSLPSGSPAQYVLEINGGLSQKLNIQVGDKMTFLKLD